jgi:hypothetical protein
MAKPDDRTGQRQQQQERGLEQPGHQGLPQQDQQDRANASQTQEPRPTWGEQTPDMDRQRAVGGGGTSSDSDGQQQFPTAKTNTTQAGNLAPLKRLKIEAQMYN